MSVAVGEECGCSENFNFYDGVFLCDDCAIENGLKKEEIDRDKWENNSA